MQYKGHTQPTLHHGPQLEFTPDVGHDTHHSTTPAALLPARADHFQISQFRSAIADTRATV